MLQRIVAGLIGLAIVLPLIIWGGQIAVEVLVAVVLLICLDEYARMAIPEDHRASLVALVAAGGLVFGTLVFGQPALGVPAIAAAGIGLLLFALFRVKDTAKGAQVAVRLLGGLIYMPVLLSFVPAVRGFENGVAWIFLILAITWLGDTGAYFAGRAFGKHKLFERVSPKKTWEGAIGGMLAAVGGALAVKAIGLPGLPWVHAIILGVLVDAIGIVGDLVESMLKRSFGVKDSGWIMPGHGGLLDRIDALLFTAPVTWIYATAFDLG